MNCYGFGPRCRKLFQLYHGGQFYLLRKLVPWENHKPSDTLHDIKLYPIHLTTGWNPTHNYAYLYIILKIWYYNHKTYEHEFVFVLRKTSSQSELTVSNKIYYFDWTILEYKYKNQTQLFYDRKTCLIQSNLP
jgi:hypothetical protein